LTSGSVGCKSSTKVKEISNATLFISDEKRRDRRLKVFTRFAYRERRSGCVGILVQGAKGCGLRALALTLDPTEKDRAEIYGAVLAFVRRFDIRQIFFAPILAVDLLVGVAATDITGAPMALFLSERADLSDILGAGDLTIETVRKSSIVFASTERLRADVQMRFSRKVWIFRLDARLGDAALREDCEKWIRHSSALRKPVDDRFEKLLDYCKPQAGQCRRAAEQPIQVSPHRRSRLVTTCTSLLNPGTFRNGFSSLSTCRLYSRRNCSSDSTTCR
jgi:hypothetical protein